MPSSCKLSPSVVLLNLLASCTTPLFFLAKEADGQKLMFKAARSLQNGANLPRLEVKFSSAKENLFVSPAHTAREYVFGGYTWRDWDEALKDGTYIDQYPIYLQHDMCGAGRYSTQARLNNPPVWKQGPDGAQSEAAFAVGNAYRFAVPSGTKQTSPVMARPCCPFADGYNKCCKKASGGNFGERLEDSVRQFWDCSTQHVCDNSNGYGDGNNRCSPIKESIASGPNVAFRTGKNDGYMPAETQLTTTARFASIAWAPAGETCGHCDESLVAHSIDNPKEQPFYRLKMFCHSDNMAMKSYWGPIYRGKRNEYSLTVPGVDLFGIQTIDLTKNGTYWTHDKYWTKEQQCKRCTDFGMMYFSLALYNSVCLKVGPGQTANEGGTGLLPSTVTANRYVPLVSTGATGSGGDKKTTLYEIVVEKDTLKPEPKITVKANRNIGGGANNYDLNYQKEFTCHFDAFSDYLRSSEARVSTACTLEAKVPVVWPSQCQQSTGKERCSVIASVVKFANLTDQSFSTKVPAGTGDTRLFARAVNLEQSDLGHPATDPDARYYARVTYDGLMAIEGKRLVYELAVLIHRDSGTGCGIGVNRYDQDAAYNTFTYYYPQEGNYGLLREEPQSWVTSYEEMVKEQRAVMEQLAFDAGSSKVEPMPVGDKESVAPCWKRRDGICNTVGGSGSNAHLYEGLPSQNGAVAASGRGGPSTPRWPDAEYFSDFPNYNKADVFGGGATKWDSASKAKIHPSFREDSRQWRTKAIRAAAVCVPCMAGYEGARLPTIDAGSTVQTGRYIRATLGPEGEKNAATYGIRATPEQYSRVCTPCSPGSYNPRPGGSCMRCPGGTFSMPAIQPGIDAFYADSAPSRCWPCLKGFSCPRLGRTGSMSVCSVTNYGNMCPCPLNTYQDEEGQETCKQCPENTATAQVGSKSESACRRGGVPPGYRFKGPTYSSANDIGSPQGNQWVPTLAAMQKVPCAKGTYSAFARLYSPSALECTPCGPGTYAPYEASTLCYPCPFGEYNNHTGQSSCLKCPCEGCGGQEGGKGDPNAIVNSEKTSCRQAPPNFYSTSYNDEDFTPCACGKTRPKGQNKCSIPAVARSSIIAQQMACHKNKTNATTAWSNYSGFAPGVAKSDNQTTTSTGPESIDRFAITALCLMLPLLATSLFVVSFSWRVSEKKEKEGDNKGKEGDKEGEEGEGRLKL
ncbi:MAG: hypothetical protein CMI26_08810 [Opitutae bacterium]|nr:hypothetical protein [Opitutae bacterium]|tara:strand:- start:3461 stop:7036 length:3576 start_codon:yes stop_codon:yes gene_type:complete